MKTDRPILGNLGLHSDPSGLRTPDLPVSAGSERAPRTRSPGSEKAPTHGTTRPCGKARRVGGRGCRTLVFLGTERSPEVCPWPLPRAGWVTVLEPGSSRGGRDGGHESPLGGSGGGQAQGRELTRCNGLVLLAVRLSLNGKIDQVPSGPQVGFHQLHSL